MQSVKDESVKTWSQVNGEQSATSISERCPYCDGRVIFSLGQYISDPKRRSVSASSQCPGCARQVEFWTVKTPTDRDGKESVDYEVFMFPRSKGGYPQPNLPDNVPPSLQRALTSTIDSLNAQNFPATAVGARRTLEGIFKYRVAVEKRGKNLYQLIDEVKASNDLAAPLESLSHAIRHGGNLGAHFDDEKEPTEAMARKMVELIDYLISYLYVLPSQITELEKALDKE